jgi:hypothetical protein
MWSYWGLCIGVLSIFNSVLATHTMALGSTQPLTEMSTRNLSGGKKRPAHGADNLTAMYEPMSENVGASTSRNPKALHGLYRDNFTYLSSYKTFLVPQHLLKIHNCTQPDLSIRTRVYCILRRVQILQPPAAWSPFGPTVPLITRISVTTITHRSLSSSLSCLYFTFLLPQLEKLLSLPCFDFLTKKLCWIRVSHGDDCEESPIGSPRRWWEDNIEMNLENRV